MDGSPVTACGLRNLGAVNGNLTVDSGNNVGDVQESLVMRDERGWMTQWIVSGLQASTNYTAFVIQDDTKVAGPIYFATKSGKHLSFPIPIQRLTKLPVSFGLHSDVPLPARSLPSLLSLHRLRRPAPLPSKRRRLRLIQFPIVDFRSPHLIHLKLLHELGDVPLRARLVQLGGRVRGLCDGVQGMGV